MLMHSSTQLISGPDTTPHPADSIDAAQVAERFWHSLTTGEHWDALMVSMRPELANTGAEHIEYTFDACVDDRLVDDEEVDPRSELGLAVLRTWCERRAPTCIDILRKLSVIDGHVRAHRLIGCTPSTLKPALGLFWTHNFDDWPDPYAPWAEDGRNAPTLVIEAMVPVDAIDWHVSCMALMDWFTGDCESELRLRPGHPLRVIGCRQLADDSEVVVPDLDYTS